MLFSRRSVYHARKPDLRETRGGHTLLIWGALAQWMVVDDELLSYLECFDGQRSLKEVMRAFANETQQSFGRVEASALTITENLVRRGILHDGTASADASAEPVGIANLTLNLTNRCNLRCVHCYNADHRTDEMPIGALMDAIERAQSVIDNHASLILLGGEPLLTPDRLITALARAASIFQPATLVSTNGTLLTQAIADALAGFNVNIQVSLDGPDAARNDSRRGDGVFDKACKGIRRLLAAGVPCVLSMAFDRQSVADFEEYCDLALALGVPEVRFIPMRMIGRGMNRSSTAPDLHQALNHLLELLDRRAEFRQLLGRDYFSIVMAVCRRSQQRSGCGIGRRVIFVDADGKVYPCPNHIRAEDCCGVLGHDELADLVRSSTVMCAMRDRYQLCRYDHCRDCAFRHWCAGDCRGEVMAVHGDPQTRSPHCVEHQAILRQMMWLIADGDKRLGMQHSPSVRECTS